MNRGRNTAGAIADTVLRERFNELLRISDPDLDAFREALIDAFNRSEGKSVDPTVIPTDEQGEAIGRWMRLKIARDDELELLRAPVFDGLESKINRVAQAPCTVCGSHLDFPTVMFTLRVAPGSQQAMSPQMRRAFARAVEAALKGSKLTQFKAQALCLRIVYVLAARRRKIDVDNLSKGTLDALEGNLYADDSQIDHLSTVKLITTGNDEMIMIYCAPTTLNEHRRDVFRRTFEVHWAGSIFDPRDYLQD